MSGSFRRILVVKLRYIGDVLLTTPVLRNLRLQYPDARIDILVNEGTHEVLRHNRDLDQVLFVPRGSWWRSLQFVGELRRARYDLVIDLTDGDRAAILTLLSGALMRIGCNPEQRWRGRCYTHLLAADIRRMHQVDYMLTSLELIGAPVLSSALSLAIDEADDEEASRIAAANHLDDGKPNVLIHAGARWRFKTWPHEYYAALADVLHNKHGCRVVFVGTPADAEAVDSIRSQMTTPSVSLVGQTTLLQLAALLKQARLFVGNDSGVMHVAAAVGTRVVAFFGLTDPAVWGPYGEGHVALYKNIDCTPCFPRGCIRGNESCLRTITVAEALDAVVKLLAADQDRNG